MALNAESPAAPILRPNSKIVIRLERTACYGPCPVYNVTVSTKGIVFEGKTHVVALGRHTAKIDVAEVRELAKSFLAAKFYSLDDSYLTSLTDSATYILSLAIDGDRKTVVDQIEFAAGLEDEVDRVAQTGRWIEDSDGLIPALRAEKFNFRSHAAQAMVKQAASLGNGEAVRALLKAGVPLKPGPFSGMGWLTAASGQPEGPLLAMSSEPEALKVLIDAGASEHDQGDKDAALAAAVAWGNSVAARALIAYGANPNAQLKKGSLAGRTVLMQAASSEDTEVVREILRYHPPLETRDRGGRTAIFAAIHCVECVQLLARAGADVKARDNDGDTPLHQVGSAAVAEELIRLGADVNSRNNNGDAPIFTALGVGALWRLIEHGADLTMRNKRGQTPMEAAKGNFREEDLLKAIR